MEPINKEKFGAFITELRKEKFLTQQELAERLFVSNKAVSKWERGQSFPDISLLNPLADILGVTVTELLRGERMGREVLEPEQVEKLVNGALQLSGEEKAHREKNRRFWKKVWVVCAVVAALEITMLIGIHDLTELELWDYLFLVEGLTLGFGGYFCFFAKETLPTFYDENKINFYSDRFFRMNMPGVHFNNSNWPHILNVGRGWMMAVAVIYPLLFALVRTIFPPMAMLVLVLVCSLSFFIPMVWAAKKYE